MAEWFQQLLEVFRNLFNTPVFMELLSRQDMMVTGFVALNLVVFTETGLLIGFFLPGDSLLVIAGIVAASVGWNLPLLAATLCASAIIGDSVGYAIGWRTGPKIFTREDSLLFKKSHLIAARDFYERHGGKTIVLARFMPIVRTFAPVVAGVGRMDYRRFVSFNVIGGIGWVTSMLLIGYFLPPLLNPIFQKLFNLPEFRIENHIDKVIIAIVLLSISPGMVAWWRARRARHVSVPNGIDRAA